MAFGISPYNANAGVNPYAGGMSNFGFSPMGQLGQVGQSSQLMTGMLQQNQMMTMMMQEMMMMLMLLMSNGGGLNSAAGGGTSAIGGGDGGGTSGGGGGVSGSGGASPNAVDASQFSGGTAAGKTLAAAAQNEANAEGTTGYCFRGVSRALHSIGVDTHGEAAYMAADQLAQNPKVKEIKVDRDKLPSLPPGAIVVWAQGPGHQYGHISVALGNGKEASDHIQSQIKDLTGQGGSYRVFMPV